MFFKMFTVNRHFSAVTIFSRFSRLASSPRKYHDRDLEQVIDVIEQNRKFLVNINPRFKTTI